MSTASREVEIRNENGLHARPAMQFVDLANQFRSTVTVEKLSDEPITVDGKSVMGMITLEAFQGTKMKITAEGDDAEEAVSKLASLLDELGAG